MKNIKVFISAIPLAFLFIACSGKVQTNKIPNETKYYLPKGAKTSDKVALDSKELQSYSLSGRCCKRIKQAQISQPNFQMEWT